MFGLPTTRKLGSCKARAFCQADAERDQLLC